MARPTFTVIFSLLFVSTASPTNDQSTMLQGKLQLMGMAPGKLKDAPAAAYAGLSLAAEDFAGRVRSPLVALFKLYAIEERAEELASTWAAALVRGKQAMDLPAEADEIGLQLLDLATEIVGGAPMKEAWEARAPRVATLAERVAAGLEEGAGPGRQAFTWAAKEYVDMMERLVPGQPVAAMFRCMLLMAKDFAVKMGAPGQLMVAFHLVDLAIQRGDFARPTTTVHSFQVLLDGLATRAGDQVPLLARVAHLVRYFGQALEASGQESASWSDALQQLRSYAQAGNSPPVPPAALQLLKQFQAAESAEEAQGKLVQAGAWLLKDFGARLGLGAGIVKMAGNLAEMVTHGNASFSSPQNIADTLKRAAGDELQPLRTNLVKALAPALNGSVMLAGIGLPEWGMELGTKLAGRLFNLFTKALGPEPSPPTGIADLFGGLVPELPGRPALQGLLGAALGGAADRALAGDGAAAGELLRAWARELREEAGEEAGH